MDKTGKITEHSEVKLDVLKRYLRSLINILHNTATEIQIIDAFCGKGGDESGKDGSAKIFLDILNEKSKQFKNIKFIAKLNDVEEENITKIRKIFSDIGSTSVALETTTLNAEDFVSGIQSDANKKQFKFLFYDPFNYAPIKKSVIQDFLKKGYSEALIFIPFSHVYRFVNGVKDGTYKDDHTLAVFLKDIFGEGYQNVENKKDNEFLRELKNAFTFPGFHCNSLMIHEKNKYALLFITRHLKGSFVFLDACYRNSNGEIKLSPRYDSTNHVLTLKIHEKDEESQLTMWGQEEVKNFDNDFAISEPSFFKDLKGKTVTNKELVEYLLVRNVLPKHVTKLLQRLKKDDKVQIHDNKTGFHLQVKPKEERKIIFSNELYSI